MVVITHASIDENKNIKGGKAGDQTGKEVCSRSWYNKPWDVVIRFTDPVWRDRFAHAMEKAAANDHIGYDQNQRNSLLEESRKYGYDPGRVTKDCETDCSALVALCCMYAGVPENRLFINGNSPTTRNIEKRLWETGRVQIFKTKDYTQSADKLVRGDILLSIGHHVAGVTKTDNVSKLNSTKSNMEVAKEVLSGKWGNGQTRRDRLTSAGYNYDEIQKCVNQLIHG